MAPHLFSVYISWIAGDCFFWVSFSFLWLSLFSFIFKPRQCPFGFPLLYFLISPWFLHVCCSSLCSVLFSPSTLHSFLHCLWPSLCPLCFSLSVFSLCPSLCSVSIFSVVCLLRHREESFYCTVPITPIKREMSGLDQLEEVRDWPCKSATQTQDHFPLHSHRKGPLIFFCSDAKDSALKTFQAELKVRRVHVHTPSCRYYKQYSWPGFGWKFCQHEIQTVL